MRSARELVFRFSQELANQRLWLMPPTAALEMEAPLSGLPSASAVVKRLRETPFSLEIERLADMMMQHRFPIAGGTIETGERIEWRRDYRNAKVSGISYFRFIPYLDFQVVGDHKVIWDLNRHQHLVVFAQAFLLTGRRELLEEIRRHIESWLADNPYMRGINWASALEVALRALSWIWVYHLVGQYLDVNLRRKISEGLYLHGLYLEHNLSLYFAPNTHLLGEAVSLEALGVLFPRFPPAARWKKLGGDLIRRQMAYQIRDDGSHFEQSSYYHVYALDIFLFHHVLVEESSPFRAKLLLMAEYLAALMGPSRTLPLIGDDDGGRLFHPYGRCDQFGRATLATCALIFNDNSWSYDEEDLYEQAAWWLGQSAFENLPRHQHAMPASRFFPVSGVAVMNCGPLHLVVDAGPFGALNGGHSHSDTLSVVVGHGEEEVLVDAGTFTYVGDRGWRNWFRSSAAHNTVTVNGIDQALAVGPFRWIHPPGVEVVAWESGLEHDLIDANCRYSNEPQFVHRRRVLLLKPRRDLQIVEAVIINDRVEGPCGSHIIEQCWHPGEPIVPVASNHICIGTRCHLVAPEGTDFEVVNQWRSRAFGEKSPAPAVVIRRKSTLPLTLWVALVFDQNSKLPRLRTQGPSAEEALLELPNGCVVEIAGGVNPLSYRYLRRVN